MNTERVAVVSSAQTQLRPAWSSAQHVDLISAVVTEVFKGTGLDHNDVDFVIDSGSDVLDGRSISNCGFLGAMGAHHKEESRVEEDGLWAALYGATKIRAGGARVGLIIAYSKPSESNVGLFYSSQCEPFYQRPVGFDHLAASGIQAQRYLSRSGLTASDLGRLASRRWSQAAQTGRVQVDEIPQEHDITSSASVAAPLRKLMMSRPVDGAVAVLLTSEDIARRASVRDPVWITGMGMSADRHAFASRKPDTLEACEVAGKSAYKQAGWKDHGDVIAETSASSVVTELMVIEALGLGAAGQALATCEGDRGQWINASGGALPADPIMATGLVRLSEAARQLGQATSTTGRRPASAVVHGAGGVGMQTHCVLTLEV